MQKKKNKKKKNKFEATFLFVDFSTGFDSINRGKMEGIFLAFGLPRENVEAIMKFYKKYVHRMETQTSLTLSQVCCKVTH